MSANLSIIKRDGSKAEFDKLKIENAILKAMKYGSGVLEEDIAKNIADEIEKDITKNLIGIDNIKGGNGSLAMPRKQEILCAINRLRTLKIKE